MTSVSNSNKAGIDDERLAFFMAPFRKDRSVNPLSWDNKMKYWNDSIKEYCIHNELLVFNAKVLPEKLMKNSTVPQCLNVVLQDMLKNRAIQSLSDYTLAHNSSWLSWSFNTLVTKPVKWSYNTFLKGSLSWAYGWVTGGSNDSDDGYLFDLYSKQRKLPDEEYVMLDLVKEAASKIYAHHNNNVMYHITDNVVSYDSLRQQCRHICADDKSFEVAIMEMCKQNLCCVKVNSDGDKIIMMKSSSKKKSQLQGNELKIYKLKMAEGKMEAEITKVEKQMEECRLSAKQCLQQGKKNLALKYLKKKKGLEGVLKQREQAIDKICNLISIIQQTESNEEILDAYSSGVQAFKGLREQTGLNESNIDDVMLDIQEAFEANEQINQTISQPAVDNPDYSMDDLEAELNDILSTSTSAEDYLKELENLPSVPAHEPGLTPPKLPATANQRRMPVKDSL